MIETLDKLSTLFKSSHFPFFLFAGFLGVNNFKEKEEEDQVPGDNFPHVFMTKRQDF